MNKTLLMCTAILALAGCQPEAPEPAPSPASESPPSEAPAKAGPTEEELIAKVVEVTVAGYKALNANNTGTWKRDAHAKSHGLLEGRFVVGENVPEHLRVGVFADPGREYRADVRFSNGNAGDQPDVVGDGRGMSIKLYEVPGEKILPPDQGYDDTQDFLLINSPVFFVKDVSEYLQLNLAFGNPNGRRIDNYFRPDPDDEATWRKLEKQNYDGIANAKAGNVLALSYWSMTPYELGPGQAVKYETRPCEARDNEVPENPAPNFLRDRLRGDMEQGSACFEFLVQVGTADMPLDDARIEWSATESPFVPVARIELPQQQFDTQARNTQDENMTFSPWHALPVHQPLGSLNAVRGKVYEAISELRHAHNGITTGPTR